MSSLDKLISLLKKRKTEGEGAADESKITAKTAPEKIEPQAKIERVQEAKSKTVTAKSEPSAKAAGETIKIKLPVTGITVKNAADEVKTDKEKFAFNAKTAGEQKTASTVVKEEENESSEPHSAQKKELQKIEEAYLSGKLTADTQTGSKYPVIVPDYEQLEYDAPTDEEISSTAKQNLKAYEREALKRIEDEAAQKTQSAMEKKSEYEQSKSGKLDEINTLYDNARRSIDNDMLKRGLARSSVALLMGAGTENERANAIAAYNAEYDRTIRNYDDAIAQAEANRVKAINDFNIEYAIKYGEEVQRLKGERQDKIEEITKYNNTIKGQAFDDKLSGLGVQGDMYDQDMKYASLREDYAELEKKKAAVDEKLYNVIRAYVSTLDKDAAREFIESDESVKNELPATYYLKLREEFLDE